MKGSGGAAVGRGWCDCFSNASLLFFLVLLLNVGATLRTFGAPPSDVRAPARARVIAVQDSEATLAFKPNPVRVRQMVDRGLKALTSKSSIQEAWLSLVSTQDVVGIKVYSHPGPNSGTRPAVAEAVVQGLLAAGLPSRQIIIWDRELVDLRLAGFFDLAERYGVQVRSSMAEGYDERFFYDSPLLGNLVWGDHEFGKRGEGIGRKSYVTKLLATNITKVVNISPMLNHNSAGVSGNLFSLASGSVDNLLRFESDPVRLATAIPEIYALPSLSDKVVLSVVDALICQYEGTERSLLHYSSTLNEIRFSRDPVALDVLSLQELERQRRGAGAPDVRAKMELYTNASLLELGVCDPLRIDLEYLR